jgi:hypothetical protein
MKTILLFATALFIGANTMAQTADFETQLPGADTAWFGQPTNGQETFTSGLFEFENSYDTTYGSWSGWAYTNITDNTTPGWSNQFGNITGSGESSSQFGVFNQSFDGYQRIRVNNNNNPLILSGAYITNTTYAYLSMLNGDMFATQFGDTSNTAGGEDWFLLTIYGINDTLGYSDSIEFYLADYRFADNTQDYIIDQWTWVDLTSLGSVYGLDFKLTSSDVGQYGMNTPAYFAMDNLMVDFTNVNETTSNIITAYPNPTTGILNIETDINTKISLYNINGQLIKTTISNSNQISWDLSILNSGVYFIQSENNGIISTQKVVKQ